MNIQKTLVFMAVLFLAGCEGRLEVSGITQDSSDFGRLPQIMRSFPIWEPIDPPLFDFEVRDGARRPSGGLSYRSGLPKEAIYDRFQSYADTINCSLAAKEPQQLRFVCDDDPARGLELYLDPGAEAGSEVKVLFIQTTPEFESVSF